MKVKTLEDIKVLAPNAEHQNFTVTNETIPANTLLEGDIKVIKGLRRGESFDYKLFLTKEGKLIYINKLKNMEEESGIDTPAKISVNLKQNKLAQPMVLGAIGGALIGFGYAKYKKHDTKKTAMYSIVGALIGAISGKALEHTGVVKISK